jgi:hypothetical protein
MRTARRRAKPNATHVEAANCHSAAVERVEEVERAIGERGARDEEARQKTRDIESVAPCCRKRSSTASSMSNHVRSGNKQTRATLQSELLARTARHEEVQPIELHLRAARRRASAAA